VYSSVAAATRRERLHHERARQDRIAREVIGEHVVEPGHVL
jgi:hypothetical protein